MFISTENDLPNLPINLYLLKPLRNRLKLAKKIDIENHRYKRICSVMPLCHTLLCNIIQCFAQDPQTLCSILLMLFFFNFEEYAKLVTVRTG